MKLGKLPVKYISIAVATVPLMVSTQVQADGLVDMINRGIEVLDATGKLSVIFGYLAGIVFGIIGLITMKSLSKPNQEPGRALGCVLCFIAAAGLIYYAATVKTVGETLYDSTDGVATGVSTNDMGL